MSSCEVINQIVDYGLLSADEIQIAANAVKLKHAPKIVQFIEINFFEPNKTDLFKLCNQSVAFHRYAEVISLCLSSNETFMDYVELFVDPTYDSFGVPSSKTLTCVQAGISPDEYTFVEFLCKQYEPLLQAVARRGLDPQYVVADSWCVGHSGSDCDPTERICWPSLYYFQHGVDDLPYARPIEGIHIKISLTQKKVIWFEDKDFHDFPIPSSMETNSNYVLPENQRKDLKPIHISQPYGPSWSISNHNSISWQKWNMSVGFSSREGVILHGISYSNRPILHRLSYAEMVVPYGDPREPHSQKNAFDAGEDGLGRNANSLVLGCDCLGLIHYFDANLVKDNGGVLVLKNAICMHEEDAGMGWKHTDWRTGIPTMSRSRRLVLSFVCTIANYEYGFYFYFYLDGTIEAEVKLTGALSTGVLSYPEQQSAGNRKYGINLGGCLYAPVHQHFFVTRMDFIIDGLENSIEEYNAVAETEGDHNPTGNGFYFMKETLSTELAAVRVCKPESARIWRIYNPNRINSIGGTVGFKIAPAPLVKPIANLAKASRLKRAQFLDHQLWVTPFDRNERYPGGEFPNQMPGVDGLPIWTQKNRSVENTDIIVWHVFGVTHLPRPEDWPIMPVEHCGFQIKPSGFFTTSPAMDVPDLSSFHDTKEDVTTCPCNVVNDNANAMSKLQIN